MLLGPARTLHAPNKNNRPTATLFKPRSFNIHIAPFCALIPFLLLLLFTSHYYSPYLHIFLLYFSFSILLCSLLCLLLPLILCIQNMHNGLASVYLHAHKSRTHTYTTDNLSYYIINKQNSKMHKAFAASHLINTIERMDDIFSHPRRPPAPTFPPCKMPRETLCCRNW